MIRTSDLKKVSEDILTALGVSAPDAAIIADSIVWAHTRGKHTHGIGRMPIYARKIREGLMDATTPITVIKDTPAIALIDAHNGFGQVAAIKASDLCIDKASKLGIGAVGVRDSNNFGTAGFIGEYAALAGMICMIYSNSAPAIAPTGGTKAIFGTNPICFAFPNKPFPIVLDMACSNAARGKIRLAAKNGEKIPFGWAVDAQGRDTDDPNEALKGNILPIGGYKGYGLSMVVDILAGMLTGSAFGGEVKNLNHPTEISRYGHFIICIDPRFFMTEEEYNKDMSTLVANVKACGEEGKIQMPGERSYRNALASAETVNIKSNLVADLNLLAAECGVEPLEEF